MTSLRHSIVFRLALGYGLLFLLSIGIISSVFYIGTAGLLERNIDQQIVAIAHQLEQVHERNGTAALLQAIHTLLTDDKDVETEEYLLLDPQGSKLIGNLTAWSYLPESADKLTKTKVERLGRNSNSRLLVHRFDDGSLLVVGRDLQEQRQLEQMILSALAIGGLLGLLLAMLGALLFRTQLQARLTAIQTTTQDVSAGNLNRRIAAGEAKDELAGIARDINRMLDDIERLMETARNVSNTIAHDLRTPLGRIRSALEETLQPPAEAQRWQRTAHYAIDEIDTLIGVFEKLLQIAEAESGVRRQQFEILQLRAVLDDLMELYQPVAETQGMQLSVHVEGTSAVLADRDLIANVLANLLDNAFKYAGQGASIHVSARQDEQHVHVVVQDNGPGMPPDAMNRATERFFRVDDSRSQRGNGLGLSIVAAVVSLHHGELKLENARPGLKVSMVLPKA
ncbi:HAMP domain-containing sensor histidine kinase [Dyella nitratireducens]|uniref:histidine kinase n=1 Tax=Dyella nitratireducens TaxID=1849580 RepID=A0ABQ1GVC4_9GAMM|nr:HAMP domain-containing sensor histidine kinase [Dyella nitratireducens]GGA50680.1 two-component sensor histidine kinase [Dyella nitratireducens]GLQ42624.1 two-component sensor histidine kinase [Dyella nitratireducens]